MPSLPLCPGEQRMLAETKQTFVSLVRGERQGYRRAKRAPLSGIEGEHDGAVCRRVPPKGEASAPRFFTLQSLPRLITLYPICHNKYYHAEYPENRPENKGFKYSVAPKRPQSQT